MAASSHFRGDFLPVVAGLPLDREDLPESQAQGWDPLCRAPWKGMDQLLNIERCSSHDIQPWELNKGAEREGRGVGD